MNIRFSSITALVTAVGISAFATGCTQNAAPPDTEVPETVVDVAASGGESHPTSMENGCSIRILMTCSRYLEQCDRTGDAGWCSDADLICSLCD